MKYNLEYFVKTETLDSVQSTSPVNPSRMPNFKKYIVKNVKTGRNIMSGIPAETSLSLKSSAA